MNEKEIITALENCTSGAPCKLCPALHKAHCMTNVMGDALNLIKSYQERIDRIVERLERISYETADWMCGGTMKAVELTDAIAIVKGGAE